MVEHQLPKLDTGVRFPSSAVTVKRPLKTLCFRGPSVTSPAGEKIRNALYDIDSDIQ